MNYAFVFQKWNACAAQAERQAAILRRYDPAHPPSVRAYQLIRAYSAGLQLIVRSLQEAKTPEQFAHTLDQHAGQIETILASVNPPYREQAEDSLRLATTFILNEFTRQV